MCLDSAACPSNGKYHFLKLWGMRRRKKNEIKRFKKCTRRWKGRTCSWGQMRASSELSGKRRPAALQTDGSCEASTSEGDRSEWDGPHSTLEFSKCSQSHLQWDPDFQSPRELHNCCSSTMAAPQRSLPTFPTFPTLFHISMKTVW